MPTGRLCVRSRRGPRQHCGFLGLFVVLSDQLLYAVVLIHRSEPPEDSVVVRGSRLSAWQVDRLAIDALAAVPRDGALGDHLLQAVQGVAGRHPLGPENAPTGSEQP